jgi:diguanylate cyclase (GGDEF)-like protein/PAS domain S-box-containing protein
MKSQGKRSSEWPSSRHRSRASKPSSAKKLSRILNSVPHVIWSADADGLLTFVSSQWAEVYGGKPSQLIGDGWIAAVHVDDRQEVVEKWAAAKDRADRYQNRFRLKFPSGEFRWVLITAKPDLGRDGKVKGWIGTCTDIHERVLAQIALAEKHELYRSVLEASADCISILCPQGRLKLMNAPGLELMEIPAFDQVEGAFWWTLWPIDIQAEVRSAVEAAAQGETVRFSGLCPTARDTPKWWNVVVTPIRDPAGQCTGILAISRDCSTEREKAQELEWASEHDALTQLPNRRGFQKRLQAAVLRSMRDNSRLGLLLIDLDHFKTINDTLGHAAGDALLKQCASRLRKSIRAEDFVARIGGDEFAVIVEGVPSAADLCLVGDKAAAALKHPLRIQGRAFCASASIGGALFPEDAETGNELFKVADTALYALKAEGRGGTKLFHSYMREAAQRVASQLNLARMAVNEESIRPYYQPKVSLSTGAVMGFEALLRWEHPTNGLQLPDTIEEAFKDYELASKIGDLMQRKVLASLRRQQHRDLSLGRISINAAPAEFMRDDYATRLLEHLCQFDVSPLLLEVEVTEHVLMAGASRYVRRALAELKEAGVKIALDDFGTGYSSLSHLRDFPVDVVKIDKSFVQHMLIDPEIAAIVTSVINLAASLKMSTVAEGIETQEQANALRAAGCTLGQGYFLGEPQPEAVLLGTPAVGRAA